MNQQGVPLGEVTGLNPPEEVPYYDPAGRLPLTPAVFAEPCVVEQLIHERLVDAGIKRAQFHAVVSPLKLPPLVTRILWLSLGLCALCGFIAAGEPGVWWAWRVGYGALVLLSLYALSVGRRPA